MSELKLLKGSHIQIMEGLNIYPLTIGEITDDIGEEIYNSFLSIITLTRSKVDVDSGAVTREELNSVNNDLELIFLLSTKDPQILAIFILALKTFLKSDIDIVKDVGIVIKNDNGTFSLEYDLFKQIKSVIMKQNYLKEEKEIEYKPVNSKAEELMEKLKKEKAKIQKQNTDNGLSLSGIVSIVATYSNDVNIFTVWNLTIYQLYEIYLRIVVWDNYHTNFLLIPHVSDSTSLDLKHWGIDINKLNNN